MTAEQMERRVLEFYGVTCPTTRQVREMADTARRAGEDMIADMIVVAAFTGLRVECELAKVRRGHFDPERDLLFVPEGKRASLGPKGTNVPRPRIVPVVGDGREALRRSIDRISPEQQYPYADLVFTVWPQGRAARPWKTEDVGIAYRPLQQQIGAPREFRALRHHYATWLLDRGCSDLDVAVALGHFDREGRPNSLLVNQRYGHASHLKALDRIREQVAA